MISNTNLMRIIAFLKRLGCSSSESQTFMEVHTSGTTTIQDLARNLKKNRHSVYYSVQQLIEKGLLFEIRKGKKRLIAAENSDVLENFIKKRHLELETLEADSKYISQLLDNITSVKHEITVVKQYEEAEGFKKMLAESLQSKSEILIFSNSHAVFEQVDEEYYQNYFSKKGALGITSRIIYSPCHFAKKLNAQESHYKINLRILDQNQGSESGFYVWDNTIAIQSFKENKRSCTIIENKDIANFFRENIFNHFWQVAKPII